MGFTLVNMDGSYGRTLLQMADDAGYSITLDDVRAASRAHWRVQDVQNAVQTWEPSIEADEAVGYEIDRGICAHLGITDAAFVAELHRRARVIYRDPTRYTIFPDVLDTLIALRRAVPRLGIVSNWDWRLPELCERLGLASYFDFIVVSARVGCSKPNPCIFREALRQASAMPERALHVGDSLAADVRGAQVVGITGVLVDRAGTAAPGDYPVVRDLREVLDWV